MKRYKRKFEEKYSLKESYKDFGNLSNYYFKDDYKDYEYGDPAKASKDIWEDTVGYLKKLEINLNIAGEFLAPAIKNATIKTLIENIKRIK